MPKKKLKNIKSTPFERGLSVARLGLSVLARSAASKVNDLFATDDQKAENRTRTLGAHALAIVEELGKLKGSIMKVGQMLSVVGEHFFPPEVTAVLKALQSHSQPVEWKAMERVLTRQLGKELLSQLEIDTEPLAAASLGQVYLARRKGDPRQLCLKVQYPGVDRAIDSDIAALRRVLSLARLLPQGERFDAVVDEVRMMLRQEMDYEKEAAWNADFRAQLAGDDRFIIPEIVPDLSRKRVLAMTFEEGLSVDAPEVAALSQERRNSLATAALDLFFTEMFRIGRLQTDPHFGNYRIRIGPPDRIVLLDFGAARLFPKEYLEGYKRIARAALSADLKEIEAAGIDLTFIDQDDDPQQKRAFAELCMLSLEAFTKPVMKRVPPGIMDSTGRYDYGASDLSKRIFAEGRQFAFSTRFRAPPRQLVFINRKAVGVFFFLSILKARIISRDILVKYV